MDITNQPIINESTESINFIRFNNSNTVFCLGLSSGFKIYNIKKNKPIIDRSFKGGIRILDILESSNIFIFVPSDKPTVLHIWNEASNNIISTIETDKFITDIKITKTYIFIIFIDSIKLYKLNKLQNIKTFHIDPNYHGDFYVNDNLLIYPSEISGTICIYNITGDTNINIELHNININSIYIKDNLLASTSKNGTTIKLFDIEKNHLINEYRRGIYTSTIYNCIISDDKKFLLTSGNSGTMHIYNIEDNDKNVKSFFSSLEYVLPEYFSSIWSSIKYYDDRLRGKHIIRFDPLNSTRIIAIFYDGMIVKYNIDTKNNNITVYDSYSLL